MLRGFIGVMALSVLTLCAGPVSSAQTDWTVQQTLALDGEPLDMVTATNSQRVYVLNTLGEILVYAFNGKLKGKIDVGTDAFKIKAGPKEDMLFLLRRNSKNMQAITINLTENIDIQGSPIKGSPSAPVTIAVFSDFQCPYCARLVPVLEQLLGKYPRKVKVVFKQFPLRSHAFAIKAAQATIAAHQQGKFWEFHDLLFKQYKQINDKKIEEVRIQLGLNAEKFKKEMNAPQTMAKIRADAANGSSAGVRGTPTVFINGKLLRDKSLNGFQRAIGAALEALKGG